MVRPRAGVVSSNMKSRSVLCGSHDPSPNAPKLLHCLEEEPASQAQSCQKESTLRWSCGLLFRLMNNTNHCF